MKLAPLALMIVTGAARADAPSHALVVHVAPTTAPAHEPIVLRAMIDAAYAESLVVAWRAIGEAAWHEVPLERSSSGEWIATLPTSPPPGLEYYIRGRDASGADVDHFASAASPHRVHVLATIDDRLEALDRLRLRDGDNEVSLDVAAHDFGNRYGMTDGFVRGELVYKRRLLRVLHELGVGFGTVDGRTPAMSSPDAQSLYRGLRFGFGEVRLRVLPSLFVDARVGLGTSQDGFEGNVRGVVTFGKPWRSCVQIGAEYLGGLGPSAWVRLQWDTAPPLLMGAAVVRTDLPGAQVAPVGMYIAYDIAYRVIRRVTVRAQLSYGVRDGAGSLGGGVGTAVAF